jgi:L-asparaginase
VSPSPPPSFASLGTKLSAPPSLYSTGGTIISASSYGPLDNINYGGAPGPTPAQFVSNNSEVLNLAQIGILSFPAPGGSAGINSSLFLNVSQYANKQLCAEGSDLVGAVVFHGTDTMIETVSDNLPSHEIPAHAIQCSGDWS